MKKKLLTGLLFVALGYALLVLFYFLYLESGAQPGEVAGVEQKEKALMLDLPMGASKSRANYATLNFQVAQNAREVEQKYEKIGSLDATTEKFEESEQQARAVIKQHNALIQEEGSTSSNALRGLHLTIGVPPENFDAVVAALKQVGTTETFNVTKTDKTNDFLELKARRTTLEKARDSLVALKAQGGKIEELVKLEQEILKLEDQIQSLGVQLGQFDKVNEFCTVRFALAETKAAVVRPPHLGYLVQSLQWASTVYLAWLGIAAVGLVVVILLLIIVEKSKLFRDDAPARPLA